MEMRDYQQHLQLQLEDIVQISHEWRTDEGNKTRLLALSRGQGLNGAWETELLSHS